MAKTRYVHQTTTGTQETIQSPAVQTSIQPQSLRSKSAERHIPPHPFMKTQTAHEAHSTTPYMEQPTNSPLDVTRNLLDGTQPQSTQSPFQGEKTKLDQQTPQNAKFDPGRELPKEVFQHQQTLPNQLFEKKEVTDVILSNVSHWLTQSSVILSSYCTSIEFDCLRESSPVDSPSQDNFHSDDQMSSRYMYVHVTPGFKPFTTIVIVLEGREESGCGCL